MRFIGHLDMMRYFQKAIRRADIDIVYTEGFSPHQVMSFAAPLGVGIISDGEYLDIEVHSSKSSKDAMDALNQVMAEGVEITDYVQLPKDAKKAMAIVAAAEYEVFVKEPIEKPKELFLELEANLNSYFSKRDEIIITKQTKKGERTLDIKPHIYRLNAYQRNQEAGFYLFLSAGSEENIKPELIVEDFHHYINKDYYKFDWQIRRKDVYAKSDHGFLPLSAFGSTVV